MHRERSLKAVSQRYASGSPRDPQRYRSSPRVAHTPRNNSSKPERLRAFACVLLVFFCVIILRSAFTCSRLFWCYGPPHATNSAILSRRNTAATAANALPKWDARGYVMLCKDPICLHNDAWLQVMSCVRACHEWWCGLHRSCEKRWPPQRHKLIRKQSPSPHSCSNANTLSYT